MQPKNPIHLNETWIGLLATGVSDTQLKTHWQSQAGSCGSQPHFSQVVLEDTSSWPRLFQWHWGGQDTPEDQHEHFLPLRLWTKIHHSCSFDFEIEEVHPCTEDDPPVPFVHCQEMEHNRLWHGRSNVHLGCAPSNEGPALESSNAKSLN